MPTGCTRQARKRRSRFSLINMVFRKMVWRFLYELGGDMMPSDTKGTVKLKNGKAVISDGTMKEPGFRDCRLTAKLGR